MKVTREFLESELAGTRQQFEQKQRELSMLNGGIQVLQQLLKYLDIPESDDDEDNAHGDASQDISE